MHFFCASKVCWFDYTGEVRFGIKHVLSFYLWKGSPLISFLPDWPHNDRVHMRILSQLHRLRLQNVRCTVFRENGDFFWIFNINSSNQLRHWVIGHSGGILSFVQFISLRMDDDGPYKIMMDLHGSSYEFRKLYLCPDKLASYFLEVMQTKHFYQPTNIMLLSVTITGNFE